VQERLRQLQHAGKETTRAHVLLFHALLDTTSQRLPLEVEANRVGRSPVETRNNNRCAETAGDIGNQG
jgi:hypothetical protein